jgi:hypothetical protein
MKRKGIIALALLLTVSATAAVCTACSFGGGTESENTSVEAVLSLDKETLELNANGTKGTIRASMTPADKSAKYEWTIDNDKIATIESTQSTCRVTPLAEGTAKVTVTVGSLSKTCTVIVGADQHVQLSAPSFTYNAETGVIEITDTANKAEDLGGYTLYFYDAEGEEKGSVAVTSGETVDTRRMEKGTYTVKLVANGATNLQLDSAPSETTATINVTVEPLYELGVGDAGALEASDHWSYYVFSWVTASEAYCYDGEVTFSFSNNASESTEYSWITQLIYNYGEGEAGKTYQMTLNINATNEGRITLGDKAVTIHEGDNEVTVGYTYTTENKGLFKIKFGVTGEVNSMKEGTVKISFVKPVAELTEQTKLEVPTFTYNAEDNTVTITDEKNSPYDATYSVGFFASETATTPKGVATVVNGGELAMDSVVTGEYYLRIMAVSTGLPYTGSDWSDTIGKISVTNNNVAVLNGGQGVAKNNPDKWYEWHDNNGNSGSGVKTTIEYAYVDVNGTLHLNYTVGNGDQAKVTSQPIKLFYMYSDAEIVQGEVYTLSFNIVVPHAGYITVNGQVVEVKEGENTISVTRAQPNKQNGTNMCTITIQLGATITTETVNDEGEIVKTSKTDMQEGEITISNIKVEKVEVEQLESPTFTYDAETGVVTVTDTNAEEKVKSYTIGLFDGETLKKSITVVSGEELNLDGVTAGTYTLKIKAVASSVIYADSEWYSPEEAVTVTVAEQVEEA